MYIRKADGRQRPLSITSLEDKITQRVVVGVLNSSCGARKLRPLRQVALTMPGWPLGGIE